jgi:hypothetical protein
MDIQSLTPEERAQLREALGQEDSAPDPIATLANVLEMVLGKLEDFSTRLDRIEADFYKKLLAGIDGMYSENMRADGMKSFGEKYGGMFSPYADDFKRVFDSDLMEKAFDYLESLKGGEGYTDEMGDGKLKELVDQIKAKLGPKEPAVVTAEVTKGPAAAPEAATEEDDMPSIENEIERMKKRDAARKKGA